jgi:hypothetical protein
MRTAALCVLVLLGSSTALYGAINQSCKRGSQEKSLIRIHGRLGVYNGGYPNLRLWHIGTHHLFGIYSDPADLKCGRGTACNEDVETKLPGNLKRLNLLGSFVYGDFEIRVLEPFELGHMQAACIVDATHIVVQR